ncbi:MAG TPA: isoprenylcysteine carboxylmethyltransferase family protein [Chloroflexi bacterium]|nr:isoprenylcysteine carboxylmethyltransferase family protein [Chloroflexota bacterium]
MAQPRYADSRMGWRELVPALLGFTLYLFLTPVLLFIAAGTVRWPMAWVYVVLLLASTIGSRLIVWKRSPDTLRERARFATARETPPQDRVLVVVVGLLGPVVTAVVAGLDHRFGWSADVPAPAQYLAALLVVIGYGLGVWAMVINPYFSAVARLQEDRGQVVVTTGPYRLVRHPAYAGGLIASLALPFMLDALWTLVPALLTAVALVLRTRVEDRMLREGLAGYTRYAETTRYRLIPGVW